MLLCHRDVSAAIYTLQSLFFALKQNYVVEIVDDGTLTKKDKQRISSFFSVIWSTITSKQKDLSAIYHKYPQLKRYFQDPDTHIKKWKLASLLASPWEYTISVEADILFYQSPQAAIADLQRGKFQYSQLLPTLYKLCIRTNTVELPFRKLLYSTLSLSSDEFFNGGLLLLQPKKIQKKTFLQMEKLIKKIYEFGYEQMLYADETITTVLFQKKLATPLEPDKYINFVDPAEYQSSLANTAILLHFSTPVRMTLFYQAIKLAWKTRFFR